MLNNLKCYFIAIRSVLQQKLSLNICSHSSFFQLYGSIIIFQRKRRNDWFAKLDEDATEVRFWGRFGWQDFFDIFDEECWFELFEDLEDLPDIIWTLSGAYIWHLRDLVSILVYVPKYLVYFPHDYWEDLDNFLPFALFLFFLQILEWILDEWWGFGVIRGCFEVFLFTPIRVALGYIWVWTNASGIRTYMHFLKKKRNYNTNPLYRRFSNLSYFFNLGLKKKEDNLTYYVQRKNLRIKVVLVKGLKPFELTEMLANYDNPLKPQKNICVNYKNHFCDIKFCCRRPSPFILLKKRAPAKTPVFHLNKKGLLSAYETMVLQSPAVQLRAIFSVYGFKRRSLKKTSVPDWYDLIFLTAFNITVAQQKCLYKTSLSVAFALLCCNKYSNYYYLSKSGLIAYSRARKELTFQKAIRYMNVFTSTEFSVASITPTAFFADFERFFRLFFRRFWRFTNMDEEANRSFQEGDDPPFSWMYLDRRLRPSIHDPYWGKPGADFETGCKAFLHYLNYYAVVRNAFDMEDENHETYLLVHRWITNLKIDFIRIVEETDFFYPLYFKTNIFEDNYFYFWWNKFIQLSTFTHTGLPETENDDRLFWFAFLLQKDIEAPWLNLLTRFRVKTKRRLIEVRARSSKPRTLKDKKRAYRLRFFVRRHNKWKRYYKHNFYCSVFGPILKFVRIEKK